MNQSKIVFFRKQIRKWGYKNIKPYPWRFDSDPYHILVSELMLHRTQSTQVIPVYSQLIEEYPSLYSFSRGNRKHISSILFPLGLRWRIDSMVDSIKYIYQKYGSVPLDYEELIKITGIGQYIAGAVLCFVNNKAYTLIDTNIVRVIGRFWGLNISGESRRRKEIFSAISYTVDPDYSRRFYYSVIDLAHEICKPKDKLCQICPMSTIDCANAFSK